MIDYENLSEYASLRHDRAIISILSNSKDRGRKMRHSMRIPAVIFLIFPIFLTACQGDRSASEPGPPVVQEPTQESLSVTESQEKPTIDSAPSPVTEPLVPTPREGLEATDPSTIVLASGKATFVEFFAFW